MNRYISPNEITGARFDPFTHKLEYYGLSITQFIEHFKDDIQNSVAVNCFPPIDGTKGELIAKYIAENIKDKNTKVFFDNIYEGHTMSCLHGAHVIIQKLGLNPSKCYFLSGGLQCRQIYDEYCVANGIDSRINILVVNFWERHAAITFNDTVRSVYKPEHLIKNKDRLFLCFNRIIRPHRIALLGTMYHKNLVDRGYYSFFPDATYSHIKPDLLGIARSFLRERLGNLVCDAITKHQHLFPLILNNTDASNTNEVLLDDKQYYDNSYFSLVTETFFFQHKNADPRIWEENSVFFSEKIFKPIICKHPFVLASRPRSLEFLRKLGYRTFHPYIDETYDTIEDDSHRIWAIACEVERLSKKTDAEWIQWLLDVKQIIEHNYELITTKTIPDFIWHE